MKIPRQVEQGRQPENLLQLIKRLQAERAAVDPAYAERLKSPQFQATSLGENGSDRGFTMPWNKK